MPSVRLARSGRGLALLAFVVPLLAPRSAAPQKGPPPGPTGSFGEDHAWDDRKAEVCEYEAEELVDGEVRRFDGWTIIGTGFVDVQQGVRKGRFDPSFTPILECNWFLSIPTGVSTLQQMASLDLRRSDMLSMKAAFSSQAWGATTYAEWRRGKAGFHVHSNADGEGDQTWPIEEMTEDQLFYEQVPLWVRSRRPYRARDEKVTLIEKRLATTLCPPPKFVPATLSFKGIVGRDDDKHINVELIRGDAVDTFVLGEKFPYTMHEWRRADGTTWKLRKTKRIAYWDLSKNEFRDAWAKE